MKLHTPIEGSARFSARIVLARRRRAGATAVDVKPGGLHRGNWLDVPGSSRPKEPEDGCAEFTLMAGTGYILTLRFAAAFAFSWIPNG